MATIKHKKSRKKYMTAVMASVYGTSQPIKEVAQPVREPNKFGTCRVPAIDLVDTGADLHETEGYSKLMKARNARVRPSQLARKPWLLAHRINQVAGKR